LNATTTAPAPRSPDCHAPVTSSTSALIVEVTNDTMKTSRIACRPCCTGSRLAAVP